MGRGGSGHDSRELHRERPLRLTPVGLYPAGATPVGNLDLAGNVWEWMANLFDEKEQCRELRGGACSAILRFFARPTTSGPALATGAVTSGSVVSGKCSLDSFSLLPLPA